MDRTTQGLIDVPWQTPNEISEEIISACRKIEKEQTPVLVRVGSTNEARKNFCVWNCDMAVKSWGGSVQHGWIVQQEPLLYQFVYHVIWVSPTGEWIDITPHENKRGNIVFLPTKPQTPKDSMVIPNRWVARVDDPSVTELIRVLDLEFRTWAAHMSSTKFTGRLSRTERRLIDRRYQKIEARIEQLRTES